MFGRRTHEAAVSPSAGYLSLQCPSTKSTTTFCFIDFSHSVFIEGSDSETNVKKGQGRGANSTVVCKLTRAVTPKKKQIRATNENIFSPYCVKKIAPTKMKTGHALVFSNKQDLNETVFLLICANKLEKDYYIARAKTY